MQNTYIHQWPHGQLSATIAEHLTAKNSTLVVHLPKAFLALSRAA